MPERNGSPEGNRPRHKHFDSAATVAKPQAFALLDPPLLLRIRTRVGASPQPSQNQGRAALSGLSMNWSESKWAAVIGRASTCVAVRGGSACGCRLVITSVSLPTFVD